MEEELTLTDVAEGVNVFFLLMSTILVLMMQAGFALYEVGTIRRTRVSVILLKNIMDASIAYACWFAVGSMFAGEGNGFIGWGKAGPFLTGDEFREDGKALAYMKFLFFAMFAGTAVTVMSGSVADRVPYLLYAAYAVWTCAFAYPVVHHWAWSRNGWMSPAVGAIGNCGVLDFAGSGVVHVFAGVAALMWAYVVKARPGRFVIEEGTVWSVNYGDGFNFMDRTQQALGVFLLWLGWFGFNCGSTLSITSSYSSKIVSTAAVNTTIAPAVCCLTSIAIEWAYFQNWFDVRKKFAMWEENEMIRRGADREQRDLHSAAINGILSGLVAITAGCATTDPRLTIVCGVVAAFIYHYTYRLQLSKGLDDAVNAVPVHLYCGIWGLLSAALMFSREQHKLVMTFYQVDELLGTCGRTNQVAANLVFAIVVVVWSGATSFALYFAVKLFFPEYARGVAAGLEPELYNLTQIIDRVLGQLQGFQAIPNPNTGAPAAAAVGQA